MERPQAAASTSASGSPSPAEGAPSQTAADGSTRKSSAGRTRKNSRFDKKKEGWRNSVFQQPVLKEGYLEKQSSGLVLKQWQRRFFELAGHYLKYYENKQTKSDETAKGKIDVHEIGEVVVAETGGVITIVLKEDDQKIRLKAPSDKAAAEWAEAIRAAQDAPLERRGSKGKEASAIERAQESGEGEASASGAAGPDENDDDEPGQLQGRKGTLKAPVLKALESYLDSCGEGEIYDGLQELDPRRHRMLREEEIEWHKTHRPNSTFYNPSWKMRPGQTKVYQSEHLRMIFVEIVGQQLVPLLEKNEWKEGTDTSKRMGTAPMSINDLLRQLERNVGAHPYFFGGFVRDMIVAVMANDIDLSLANTYDELQIIMQWVDSKNWLHSIDSKRTVTLEEAVKEGWKKAKHPDYLNYGDQNGDDAVESKVFSVYAFVDRPGIRHTLPSHPGWQHADFTCNELAYDSRYALLIDPSGMGVKDAKNKRLRIPWATEAEFEVWLHRMGRYEGLGRWFKFRCRRFVGAEKKQRQWLMEQLVTRSEDVELRYAMGTALKKEAGLKGVKLPEAEQAEMLRLREEAAAAAAAMAAATPAVRAEAETGAEVKEEEEEAEEKEEEEDADEKEEEEEDDEDEGDTIDSEEDDDDQGNDSDAGEDDSAIATVRRKIRLFERGVIADMRRSGYSRRDYDRLVGGWLLSYALTKPKPPQWSCSKCTLRNRGPVEQCEACGAPKPAPAPAPAPTSAAAVAASAPKALPAPAPGEPAIATTVTAPNGTDHDLGPLALTTTVLEVKQQLARMTPMSVASQTLFHMEDGRDGEEEGADLRLRDGETVDEVRRYGSGWRDEGAEEVAVGTVLRLCVVVDDGRVCEFDHIVQASGSGDSKVAGQFDTKGVLYLLGTHAGAREYENPMESGEIVAAMSSAVTNSSFGVESAPWRLVEHAHPGGNNWSNCNRTKPKPHSWISIDLGASRALRLTHYALRHGDHNGYARLRSWRLEGSNDPSSGWVRLKEHKDDESLPDQGWCVGDWAVEGVEQEYRHFRIIQTGKDSIGNDFLACAGLELYGELRGAAW